MAKLSDGRMLIAGGQGTGAIVLLDGNSPSVPPNALGWGQIGQIVSMGDGEAFLTTNDGELLRFDGSGIVQFSTGWGVVEQLVTMIPEPSTFMLFAAGGLLLARVRRRS